MNYDTKFIYVVYYTMYIIENKNYIYKLYYIATRVY
jgi:hypothetical protein